MTILPFPGVIYVIQCLVSGGVYVGQTIRDVTERWIEHRKQLRGNRHGTPHLQAAWNKYGEQAFEFCVIETFATIAETNDAECFYIQYFRSIGVRLYNSRLGGRNGRMSDEAKAKISASKIGHKKSAEELVRRSETRRGFKHSEETIARMRQLRHSDESKEKNRVASTGRKASDETRAKMSAWQIGRKMSAESVEKMRLTKIGRTASAETRAKQSAAQLARRKKNIE